MVCSRKRRTACCSSLSVDSIRSHTFVLLVMMVMLLMGCHKATAFVPRTASQTVKALVSTSSLSISNSDPTTTSAASFSSSDNSGYARPVVQWYPGHIAKAERQLQETMKAVDVVIEVRDARICKATAHPMVGAWCAGRPRLVVLTHVDQVPKVALQAWQRAYDTLGAAHPDQAAVLDGQILHQARQAARERAKYDMPTAPKSSSTRSTTALSDAAVAPVQDVILVNAKLGAGVPALQRAIFKAGAYVQERRLRRGLKARPLRVGVIGYPNVGKSALINRLLGRKRARTANTPGVTRSLQWIRVRQTAGTDKADGSINSSSSTGKEFELLDSPGIIPATLVDQSDATLLAACNCIGQAAYDNQAVAAYLCEWLLAVYRLGYGRGAAPTWRQQVQSRYGFDPLSDVPTTESILPNFDVDDDDAPLVRPRTGEDILYEVADRTCQGDPEDAARKILQDFRTGRLGNICLQIAPSSVDDKGQRAVLASPAEQDAAAQREREAAWEAAQAIRAKEALEVAQARGIALPPVVEQAVSAEEGESNVDVDGEQAGEAGPKDSKKKVQESEIGKGLFDGW